MCMSRSTATMCSKARRWHSASRWRRNTSCENADVILSLDADFLYAGFPGFTRYARDFAKRRNPDAGEMSRLYVVESTPSSTGAKADHRLPVRAAEIEAFCGVDSEPGVLTTRGLFRVGSTGRDSCPRSLSDLISSPRLQCGDRRRPPAAGRSCARPCHQSGAGQRRQDGFLHRSSQCQSGEPDRVAQRPGRGHARRQGGHAGDHGWQSRLRCSRRPGIRRRAQEHEAFRCGSISASIRTKPRNSASGT